MNRLQTMLNRLGYDKGSVIIHTMWVANRTFPTLHVYPASNRGVRSLKRRVTEPFTWKLIFWDTMLIAKEILL